MKVDYSDAKGKVSQLQVTQVLQMQPMPEGYYVVGKTEASGEYPDTISTIDAILFTAIVHLQGKVDVVQCYGIENPFDHSLVWRHEDEVEIYPYGSYVRTCKLLEKKPVPFIKWYQDRQKGYCEFDLALSKSTLEVAE